MSVLEINTIGVKNQPLERLVASEELEVSLEADSSLQMSEGDVVTLSFSDKQNLSNSYSEPQFEDDQSIQEISSVARAASQYSQVVEGGLNDDEMIAIQKITAHVEPVAREFLSSNSKELDVEKAIGILTGDQAITEGVGVELGNTVVKALVRDSSFQGKLDDPVKSVVIDAENLDINIEKIRQLPELASAAVDAELQKQFQVLNESSRALIVNSLNDLMQFFQEKVSKVLEPLRHPISLAASLDLVDSKPEA
ncbi:MAG: hypothetical protein HOB32_09690 [Nitrospina sp.]|nr:hypothetical protein [Nitrospina sp.]